MRPVGPTVRAGTPPAEAPVAAGAQRDPAAGPATDWAPRRPAGSARLLRVLANLAGAFGAVLFARAGLQHYLHTHSLVGALFLAEQLWVVVAFLVRRPARAVSPR